MTRPRIEVIATTATVLVVAGVVLTYNRVDDGWRSSAAIAGSSAVYVAMLAMRGGFAVRRPGAFVAAGVLAGVAAAALHTRMRLGPDIRIGMVAGAVIGAAHWLALRAWTRLAGAPGAGAPGAGTGEPPGGATPA